MPISRQRTDTVSSEYLRLLAAGAEARGLDVGTILAASGIDRAILQRRGARVGAGAATEAWKRTSKRLDDPLFALTASEGLPMGALSLMDYLVLSSADVADGLARVVRFAPLMSDAQQVSLTLDGNEARFRFQTRDDVPYPVEMIVGLFAQRARAMFGPAWSLKRFSFAHAALGPRSTYDRICQAPVQFGMPFTEAVFARDLAALPMAGADARLSAMFLAEAEAALAAIQPPEGTPSFIDTVRRVLEDGLYERDLTLTRLADHLGVSPRTLQRRLRAAGVTHRGLVRAVRQEVATRSLAARISQGKIARSLGYSGAGAFKRAFKRWSGLTPGQHRAGPRRALISGPVWRESDEKTA
jgi:AraC-like DNA-binding protein